MSNIDDNYNGVTLAVKDNATQDVAPLKVDPVTGYLLIAVYNESSNDLILPTKIDNNYEGVAMAVSDDVSQTILPLKVQATSGGLLVDII